MSGHLVMLLILSEVYVSARVPFGKNFRILKLRLYNLMDASDGLRVGIALYVFC